MEIRNVAELKNWEENPRSISTTGWDRLKKQLQMGQHSTLLITPDGTVLGGNQRLRAMKELGIPTAKCLLVDFVEESGAWYALIDGEKITTKSYQSKEDGMMAFSLSHNDSAGYYDKDLVANLYDRYAINWDEYAVSFEDTPSLKKMVEDLGDVTNNTQDEGPKMVECPECHAKFDPNKL